MYISVKISMGMSSHTARPTFTHTRVIICSHACLVAAMCAITKQHNTHRWSHLLCVIQFPLQFNDLLLPQGEAINSFDPQRVRLRFSRSNLLEVQLQLDHERESWHIERMDAANNTQNVVVVIVVVVVMVVVVVVVA